MAVIPAHAEDPGTDQLEKSHLIARRPAGQTEHRLALPQTKSNSLARPHSNTVEYLLPPQLTKHGHNEIPFTSPCTSAGQKNIGTRQVFKPCLLNLFGIVLNDRAIMGNAERLQPSLDGDDVAGIELTLIEAATGGNHFIASTYNRSPWPAKDKDTADSGSGRKPQNARNKRLSTSHFSIFIVKIHFVKTFVNP